MILSIDTSDPEKVTLTLTRDGKKSEHIFRTNQNLSETLVLEIKKFLGKQKVKLNQIKKVEAVPGPGHFSRIRTGVALANALALGLGLKQQVLQAIYDKAPNITPSKRRTLDPASRERRG